MVQAFVYQFKGERPGDVVMSEMKLLKGTASIIEDLDKCCETHHYCVGCPKYKECQNSWDIHHTAYSYRDYGRW